MKKKRNGCTVTSLHGKVYVMGGFRFMGLPLSSCEMFDPATNQWTAIPDMKKETRGCSAACAIGNKIYAIGGFNFSDHDGTLSSVEAFDTKTQEWSSIPNMKMERMGCAAVTLENKIYVFGGRDGRGNCLSSAEVYDVTTQEWTQFPKMKEKRYGCAASTVVGNTIYIVGGQDDGSYHDSSCEVFDTSTNTWSSSTIPDMIEKRGGCQAVTIDSNIYVMGGCDGSFIATESTEAFEISMSSLYPINHNYVTLKDGYCSPKSLENLSIDQMCRSLPDLDGEIPPKYPQHVIHTILDSLVSHGALNFIPLEAFKHYELDQLTAVNKRLLPLS